MTAAACVVCVVWRVRVLPASSVVTGNCTHVHGRCGGRGRGQWAAGRTSHCALSLSMGLGFPGGWGVGGRRTGRGRLVTPGVVPNTHIAVSLSLTVTQDTDTDTGHSLMG